MTSLSRPQASGPLSRDVQSIFLIVGLVSVVGFVAAMLIAAIPPDPMALEWRVAFMQQLSGRSIVLLLGTGLILYSLIENKTLTRYLALACLMVGILLPLSCVLVVRDNLVVQRQTFTQIDEQSQQLQDQVNAAANSPDLPDDVTPEQIQAATLQITEQTETLKQNARSQISRSILSTAGSLTVVGLGLLGLGRDGIKRSS